ncbi:hypothetical protein PEDI_50270 [Persicobacter diffluens]|uniref:Uncharacterized protein n=1 Tax=Persicobacter diffluens TaxID=981 RepID=A0AAN4W5I3_9BACT|nr:hypothetical protein PEDI_50270 [Persicobacter diffluens]
MLHTTDQGLIFIPVFDMLNWGLYYFFLTQIIYYGKMFPPWFLVFI